MDPLDSENTGQECRIKTEILEDFVNESSIKNEISEKPLQEPNIKKETAEDSFDEDWVKFEITENPLDEHSMKTEVVQENVLLVTPQDDLLPKDPLEPTLRKQHLDSQAKLMLLNVIRYFQKFRLKRAKETGEDMNVNITVAEATGVSESTVKKLLAEYRNKGIEMAIRPDGAKTRVRKRKTDTIIGVGDEEATATVTIKNKQKKK